MIVVFTLCLGMFACYEIETFESKAGSVESIIKAKEECEVKRRALEAAVDWAKCVRSMK